jgi:hypothetical protein
MIVQPFPERGYSSLNLCNVNPGLDQLKQLTIICLTVGFEKSSVPVYTPRVTMNPPSTVSSLILLSLSIFLASLSFANFLASLSARVSFRASGLDGSKSIPPLPGAIPKIEISCLEVLLPVDLSPGVALVFDELDGVVVVGPGR